MDLRTAWCCRRYSHLARWPRRHDQFGTDPMHHFGVTRVNGCASGLLKYRQFSERRPVTHVTRAELFPVRCTHARG